MTETLLAIDPGAKAGHALFRHGALTYAGLGFPADADIPADATVVVERPCIYPGRRQKARPRDIITLALTAGQIAGVLMARGLEVRYVEPAEWKGGAIGKEVSHARIKRRLTEDEHAVLEAAIATGGYRGKRMAPTRQLDLLDAIGIGLWAIGRQA